MDVKEDGSDVAAARDDASGHTRLKRFGALAALTLAAITVIVIFSRGDETVSAPDAGLATPHVTASPEAEAPLPVTDDGAVRIEPHAAERRGVVVTVVEDFLCEGCADFAVTYGPTLRQFTESGSAVLEFVSVVDDHASRAALGASQRMANASLCVAADDIANWTAFREAVYGELSVPGGSFESDAQLIELAQAYGASHAVEACIRELRFDEQVRTTSQRWSDVTTAGLPLVLVNGERVRPASPESLEARVRLASNES